MIGFFVVILINKIYNKFINNKVKNERMKIIMFNIFKSKKFKNSHNETNNQKYQDETNNQEKNQISSNKKIINELEEKFGDYDYLNLEIQELFFDERFIFIYRYLKNLKDSLIIASTLKQIGISLQDVTSAYSLDEEYVNKIIAEKLPELRVALYKEIEDLPNKKTLFEKDFNIEHYTPLYQELIDRIEYFFETKRNTNQVLKAIKNEQHQSKLINNSSFLFLLNYFSIKDSLIIASSLDIIEIDEDEITNMYHHDEQYTENLLKNNFNQIYNDLKERIKKLNNIEPETSYFEYQELSNQYQDLLERIEDTHKYINNSHKRR